MAKVRSVRDADVSGKRVLVRVNFDVPMRDGKISDDTRIRSSLPTVEFLHTRGTKQIVLLTHVGRPAGKVVEEFRVAPMAARFRELTSVPFEIEENLRFDAGEESNNPIFAKKLASLGDIFVNDAFSMSHRTQASVVTLPKLLPSYAGLCFEEEITKLSAALTPPAGSIAIIGGAKGETKIPLIEKIAVVYEKVLVGGALANEYVPQKTNVFLPADGIPQLKGMFDIGPQTKEQWSREITEAPFVLWNGPVGMYETQEYSVGTDALAKALATSNAKAVIGGGNTTEALAKFSFDPNKVFISTGGGAMLQFLVDGTLPGIEALRH